jgi:hypothetical protein
MVNKNIHGRMGTGIFNNLGAMLAEIRARIDKAPAT